MSRARTVRRQRERAFVKMIKRSCWARSPFALTTQGEETRCECLEVLRARKRKRDRGRAALLSLAYSQIAYVC